jgi:AraC-like DNA-binding protein
VGMPPAAFLTDMRLTLAASYLRQNHSVKRTAQAVGYSSQPAFTKAFSAKFGMAPLKWLAQQS